MIGPTPPDKAARMDTDTDTHGGAAAAAEDPLVSRAKRDLVKRLEWNVERRARHNGRLDSPLIRLTEGGQRDVVLSRLRFADAKKAMDDGADAIVSNSRNDAPAELLEMCLHPLAPFPELFTPTQAVMSSLQRLRDVDRELYIEMALRCSNTCSYEGEVGCVQDLLLSVQEWLNETKETPAKVPPALGLSWVQELDTYLTNALAACEEVFNRA